GPRDAPSGVRVAHLRRRRPGRRLARPVPHLVRRGVRRGRLRAQRHAAGHVLDGRRAELPLRPAARARRVGLHLLHPHRLAQELRAGRQPAGRADFRLARAASPGARGRPRAPAVGGRERRLLRVTAARQPDRRLGVAAEQRAGRPGGARGASGRDGRALRHRAGPAARRLGRLGGLARRGGVLAGPPQPPPRPPALPAVGRRVGHRAARTL
ncbi:MAG: Pyridoxamine 5'-phosphate oxidase, partial [uncultured Solirubrobacteraceae bacterium]